MGPKIFLCVTLDTECDKNTKWETRFPLNFRSVLEGIPQKATPLFCKYNITPTYFLSPEVIRNSDCIRFLSQITRCELGAHLHGEFIEPMGQPDAPITQSVQAQLSFDVEQNKLRNLTTLFIDKFGYAPKCFRAGRFGLSRNSLEILGDLGYLVDSSITPFYTHYFTNGIINNYWGAPIEPYFPSINNFCKKGSSKVLEVPITVINSTFLHWPRWFLRQLNNRSFIHKRLLPRMGFKVERTKWLRPKYSTAAEMITIAEQVIRKPFGNKPHILNMMCHTNDYIPGGSPQASSVEDVEYIISSQLTFFDYLFSRHDVVSVGISHIYPLFN